MAGPKILVFGGTGPAGICLLRELVHRNHPTIAYARNPAKIPTDLSESPILEIIQGEIDDRGALSAAISKSKIIISLLGPNTLMLKSYTLFPDFYRAILPLMREHQVTRIYAMGTISIPRPQDRFSFIRACLVWLVYLAAHAAYQNIIGIGKVFEEESAGLEWTIFRIGGIPGGSDEASWKKDREQEVAVGWVGDETWSVSVKRSALAKWLVDTAEGHGKQWVGEMPAVSGKAGVGGKKSL